MQRGGLVGGSGASPAHARRHNLVLVLRSIHEREGISRADLARLTGLSSPAITAIVNELLGAGLVREDGLDLSTGGRRGTTLRIEERARYVVGVDLARHNTRVAITDLHGRILHQVVSPTSDLPDPQANLHWLEGLIAGALDAFAAPREELLGIGVGAPGPLRTTTGQILVPTYFGHWQHLPLRSALEARFGLPVRVDNDANACVLAEHWFGAGRDLRNFVYVAVDSGVGSGLLLNGDVYRGAHDIAGEIGHATVDANGPLCPCGNVGCLELYATLGATLARWPGWRAATNRATAASYGEEVAGIAALIAAARAGDWDARAALATTARYLAIGVVNVINCFDPEVVVIGRELAAAGDLLLDPVRAAVAERAFATTGREVPIRAETLGQDTPVIGAACLLIHELFFAPDLLGELIASARGSTGRPARGWTAP